MASFDIGNPFWQYSFPEYELEGYWTCLIQDDVNHNSRDMLATNLMPLGFDKYVQSVSIPQLTLDYDSTEYGLMSFKDKSAYDTVTLSFYDDIKGTCLGFFENWLHHIYNEELNVLLPNWRYEAKDIIVTYYRTFYGNAKPIASYKMIKCLPKSVSDVSTEEEAGSRKTFSTNLLPQRVSTLTRAYKTANVHSLELGDTIYTEFEKPQGW